MGTRGMRWQDLPQGGVILQPGNSSAYQTGSWRAFRPVINWEARPGQKACTKCLVCWLYCPESGMRVEAGVFAGVDLDHCKGCGLCAVVCPGQCITMVEENQADASRDPREREGAR